MRILPLSSLRVTLSALLIAQLIMPSVAYSIRKNRSARPYALSTSARMAVQSTNLKIKEQNPVVNEGNQITLTATNANGQTVTDVTFESGSPEIASVDKK